MEERGWIIKHYRKVVFIGRLAQTTVFQTATQQQQLQTVPFIEDSRVYLYKCENIDDLPALAGHGTVQRVEETCVHEMMLNLFT